MEDLLGDKMEFLLDRKASLAMTIERAESNLQSVQESLSSVQDAICSLRKRPFVLLEDYQFLRNQERSWKELMRSHEYALTQDRAIMVELDLEIEATIAAIKANHREATVLEFSLERRRS